MRAIGNGWLRRHPTPSTSAVLGLWVLVGLSTGTVVAVASVVEAPPAAAVDLPLAPALPTLGPALPRPTTPTFRPPAFPTTAPTAPRQDAPGLPVPRVPTLRPPTAIPTVPGVPSLPVPRVPTGTPSSRTSPAPAGARPGAPAPSASTTGGAAPTGAGAAGDRGTGPADAAAPGRDPHPVPGTTGGAPPPAEEHRGNPATRGLHRIGGAAGTVLTPVGRAAGPAGRGAGLGLLGTAPLLVAFLAYQDRIDRRDPKIALAPAFADSSLLFDDTPRGVSDDGTAARSRAGTAS